MINGITVLDKESMRDAHAPAFASVNATAVSAFMNSKYAPKVKGVDYIPGKGRLLSNGSYHALNKWSGFGVNPKEGCCETVQQFLIDLFPEMYALEHLLNCWAFLLQHPYRKIRHVFLVTGGQGVGKSTLRVILEKILGFANVGTVNTGDWDKPFNAHLTDLQVAVIEELMASDQMQS